MKAERTVGTLVLAAACAVAGNAFSIEPLLLERVAVEADGVLGPVAATDGAIAWTEGRILRTGEIVDGVLVAAAADLVLPERPLLLEMSGDHIVAAGDHDLYFLERSPAGLTLVSTAQVTVYSRILSIAIDPPLVVACTSTRAGWWSLDSGERAEGHYTPPGSSSCRAVDASPAGGAVAAGLGLHMLAAGGRPDHHGAGAARRVLQGQDGGDGARPRPGGRGWRHPRDRPQRSARAGPGG